jgi:hypothetical protein
MTFRLDWRWFFGRDTTDPRRVDSRSLARLLIAMALAIFAIETYGLARIQAFASGSPEVVQASGRVWIETGARGGSSIHLDTGHGWFRLSADAPRVLGHSSSGVRGGDVIKGGWATVAWIDAPAGLYNGTTHFPLKLEQQGRRILGLTPQQVAKKQRQLLLDEFILTACMMFVPSVLWLILGYRRHQAGIAQARTAWQERRARNDEHSS